MPGRGPRFLGALIHPASPLLFGKLLELHFLPKFYGAWQRLGLSYSCRFDRGLHRSASNPHALTAGERPAAPPALGTVLRPARGAGGRPGCWAQVRATHAQVET